MSIVKRLGNTFDLLCVLLLW